MLLLLQEERGQFSGVKKTKILIRECHFEPATGKPLQALFHIRPKKNIKGKKREEKKEG